MNLNSAIHIYYERGYVSSIAVKQKKNNISENIILYERHGIRYLSIFHEIMLLFFQEKSASQFSDLLAISYLTTTYVPPVKTFRLLEFASCLH